MGQFIILSFFILMECFALHMKDIDLWSITTVNRRLLRSLAPFECLELENEAADSRDLCLDAMHLY